MSNPLVGHIDIIHADHELRKIIFDLEQISKLPFLCFFIDKQISDLNIDAFPLLLGNKIKFRHMS